MSKLAITKDDYYLDQVNDFLSLKIVTDFDMNSSSFFDVKFDKYGDHVQTGVSEYPGTASFMRNIIAQPTKYQLIWKDKTRPHVTSAKQGSWDYINSIASGEKDKSVFWVALSFADKNGVVKFDEDKGQFSLIMLQP
ncbi:MAG: hypothetical protein ACKO96_34640 [Flammeovirgaceae bacterium]